MGRNRLLRIWLGICTQYSEKDGAQLEDAFGGNISDIFEAEDYSSVPRLSSRTLTVLSDKSLDEAEKTAEYCEKNGISVIVPDNENFPQRLLITNDRPILLYAKGNLADLGDRLCISVVGTRKMSSYGERCAYAISYDLAKAGAVIVSGMAKDIDSVAHRAALDALGTTIAVLGNGLDRAYPKGNAKLMEEIVEKGCIISEFKPTTKPEKRNFPMRNRIISRLSQGVLVVEALQKSGALSTAEHALIQHRRVYAVPGKIGERLNVGTNELIENGARIITSGREIIAEHSNRYPTVDESKIHIPPEISLKLEPISKIVETKTAEAETVIAESPDLAEIRLSEEPIISEGLEYEEAAVLSSFVYGKIETVDGFVEKTELDVSMVLSALTVLEIYGRIKNLPGEKYTLG